MISLRGGIESFSFRLISFTCVHSHYCVFTLFMAGILIASFAPVTFWGPNPINSHALRCIPALWVAMKLKPSETACWALITPRNTSAFFCRRPFWAIVNPFAWMEKQRKTKNNICFVKYRPSAILYFILFYFQMINEGYGYRIKWADISFRPHVFWPLTVLLLGYGKRRYTLCIRCIDRYIYICINVCGSGLIHLAIFFLIVVVIGLMYIKRDKYTYFVSIAVAPCYLYQVFWKLVNGLHLYSAFQTLGCSKRFTLLPRSHPFLRTFIQRRRCQPRGAAASTWRAPDPPLYTLLSHYRPVVKIHKRVSEAQETQTAPFGSHQVLF